MNKEEIIKLIEETKKEIDKQAVTANANVYFMTKEKAEWFIALALKNIPRNVLRCKDGYYRCPYCTSALAQAREGDCFLSYQYCKFCGQHLTSNWSENCDNEQAKD